MQILKREYKKRREQHLIKIPTGEYNVLEELAADAARPHHEQPGLPDPGLQVRGQHTLKLSHLQTIPIPNCLKIQKNSVLDHERNRQTITRRGGYYAVLVPVGGMTCMQCCGSAYYFLKVHFSKIKSHKEVKLMKL
jgi:hypothetical protein